MNAQLGEITEYRGIEGLVAAEVLKDNNESGSGEGYVTGDVFSIAGIAELSRKTDSSNEAHYYDNIPAVVISSTGADEVTINASAIPLDVLAKITGQNYDEATGSLIEGPRVSKYFAIGYKTKKTNGDEVYVWRYKGTFNIPDSDHKSEDDGTDANGQEIVFTGITTTHKFNKTGKGSKAINVDLGKDLADVSTFFDEVTTPDTLVAKEHFTLSITQAAGTTVKVMKNGVELSSGAAINQDDILVITVTGGTVKVNNETFTSGDPYRVTANVTVVSTAEA